MEADAHTEFEHHTEFVDDGWDLAVAGWREIDVVVYVVELDDDGVEVAREEVARERVGEPAWYDPTPVGELASDETKRDHAEIAIGRAAATGEPVVVAGFVDTGEARVSDVHVTGDGDVVLEDLGIVPVAASPRQKIPPFIPRLWRKGSRSLGQPVTRPREARTRARPRERRVSRPTGSRAPPSDPDELDPPPVSRFGRWLERLLRGGAA